MSIIFRTWNNFFDKNPRDRVPAGVSVVYEATKARAVLNGELDPLSSRGDIAKVTGCSAGAADGVLS